MRLALRAFVFVVVTLGISGALIFGLPSGLPSSPDGAVGSVDSSTASRDASVDAASTTSRAASSVPKPAAPKPTATPAPTPSPTPLSPPLPIQKGISYVSWHAGGYSSPESDRNLQRLATLGVRWVALIVTGYQERANSTSITWKTTATPLDADLAHATGTAHRLGMKVMLKPHVDFLPGLDNRRGAIGTGFEDEKQRQAWFVSYREALLHYAELAQGQGMEQLCVGTELEGVSGREGEWRDLVREVRARFQGRLVYAGNHGGEERLIRWWDALDYIGVDAYYPLSDRPNPSVAELKAAWAQKGYVALLSDLSRKYRKPVLFTEIGYRSVEGAGRAPWDWQRSARPSEQEQANCYQAAIETFGAQPWFSGYYWWNCPAAAGPGDAEATSFTPLGKAAEKVLGDFYITFRGRRQ